MSQSPVICFGQQPCGFFPRRYLFAKIQTARRLREEFGGEVVFFCHDSDHDFRETRTILRHRKTDVRFEFNFAFANQIQRKYSPLYLKRVSADWRAKTEQQLREYVSRRAIEEFHNTPATDAATFCLEMYRKMDLLENIRVARSSDPEFRRAARDVADFYVDVPYADEVVRARFHDGALRLYKGGDSYIPLGPMPFGKEQISPTRATRLGWMQSVLNCTHYVAGASEQSYLNKEDAPEIVYVNRDPIERPDEAYTDFPD